MVKVYPKNAAWRRAGRWRHSDTTVQKRCQHHETSAAGVVAGQSVYYFLVPVREDLAGQQVSF
jgi:hypothetical protein